MSPELVLQATQIIGKWEKPPALLFWGRRRAIDTTTAYCPCWMDFGGAQTLSEDVGKGFCILFVIKNELPDINVTSCHQAHGRELIDSPTD